MRNAMQWKMENNHMVEMTNDKKYVYYMSIHV